MGSLSKQIFGCLLVLIIAGCDTSGCSGCAGCGVEPIPGGFPLENRIENAGQVRLTSHGVDFVEQNLSEIVGNFLPDGLSFQIPQDTFDLGFTTATLCPSNDCWVDLELLDTSLQPTAPNILAVALRMSVRTRNLEIAAESPIPCSCGCDWDGCECDNTVACAIGVDTSWENPDDIAVTLDVVFTTDPHTGYTQVEVVDPQLDDLAGGDFEIAPATECLWEELCSLANIDILKDLLITVISSQLGTFLEQPIQDQLCRKCTTDDQCPNGGSVASTCEAGTCTYDDDGTCVPLLLGTEGRADLGRLLASVTPGLQGLMQFTFASGGDGVADTGLNLAFFGGLDSLEHNRCVPVVPPPEEPTIPIATGLRRNETPDGDPSMVNVGISEDYLNWASYGVFDSGMLCIGAGPRLSQSLSTGLFSLVFPSLSDIAFPAEKVPVALQLRPQTPPFIDVGAGTEDDPLLGVFMDDLKIDFYAFAEDRYVRFMTVQVDMGLSIDLELGPDGLLPVIGDPEISNVVVTNSEMMQESPEDIAAVFSDLIGIAAGTFLGSLQAFPLPDLLGFQLDVPEDGITRVTELDSDFLAFFANLSFAPEEISYEVETRANLDELTIDPSAYDLQPGWRDRLPTARLRFTTDERPDEDVEYSYRVDEMTWSHWSRQSDVTIRSKSFLLQGEHTVEVRSRLAGQPRTADTTPARVDFTIDTRAPRLELVQGADRVTAQAVDVVSRPEELQYSRRIDAGDWSAWAAAPSWEVPAGAAVEVRVRDRSGNVAQADLGGIIRGRPSPTNPAACDCRATPGVGGGGAAPWLLGLILLLAVAIRRARRAPSLARVASVARSGLWSLVLLPVAFLVGGCDCAGASGDDGSEEDGGVPAECDECGRGSECCADTGECVESPDYGCDPGYECDPTSGWDADSCSWAEECNCTPVPPIDPGFIGSYTDFATGEDGTVWVSGYEEGNLGREPFGDLVVGPWRQDHVDWAIVDGLPAGGEIVADPTGWRGGVEEAGPDVGRFTSIAMGPNDSPRVAYYDVTNGDLKFALNDDGTWVTQTVDASGDAGRYASLVSLPDQTPAIAYWTTVPDPDRRGRFVSRAVYAEGNAPNPTGWTFEVLHEVSVPCRPWYCAEGEVCGADGQCFEPGGCNADCANGEDCNDGTCVPVLADGYLEDWPEGTGLFASMRLDPDGNPGVVYYDHTGGDLYRSWFDGDDWSTELVDGIVDGVDTGDLGLSPSLVIDEDGAWHVAYIDGWSESLLYLRIGGSPEVVDDGFRNDGLHLVGDDAHLSVAADGDISVVYQDATAGTLERATRAANGSWSHETVDDAGTTGFFAKQLEDGSVGCYFRDYQADPPVAGVRILSN